MLLLLLLCEPAQYNKMHSHIEVCRLASHKSRLVEPTAQARHTHSVVCCVLLPGWAASKDARAARNALSVRAKRVWQEGWVSDKKGFASGVMVLLVREHTC